jgi:membrane protein YqaA with SNARE-associated domain
LSAPRGSTPALSARDNAAAWPKFEAARRVAQAGLMTVVAIQVLQADGWQLSGVFLLVFLLNLLPAFAPPTWVALSAFTVGAPDVNPVGLALTGAAAATCGRIMLAKLSRVVSSGKLLSEDSRKNIDEIRVKIEVHRTASVFGLIAFALSPLPSNHLFIAYGLTSLNIAFAAIPFFVGRLASYSFWIFTAAAAGQRFDLGADDAAVGVGLYFIVTQLLIVPSMYLFVRLDWNALFERRRLQLRKAQKS